MTSPFWHYRPFSLCGLMFSMKNFTFTFAQWAFLCARVGSDKKSETTNSAQESLETIHNTGNYIKCHCTGNMERIIQSHPAADPGFPIGEGGGWRRPPMWALFSENVCENERIGSCWGGAPAASPLGSATAIYIPFLTAAVSLFSSAHFSSSSCSVFCTLFMKHDRNMLLSNGAMLTSCVAVRAAATAAAVAFFFFLFRFFKPLKENTSKYIKVMDVMG